MPRHALPASILLALALPALAQPGTQSNLFITADGQTAVSVLPGAPVRLAVAIDHNGYSVAGFQGGVLVSANAGTASNFTTLIPSLPTVVLGGFTGGSRTGVDVAFTPPGFIGGPTFPSAMNPMPVFEYDIAFDEPGVYEVNWTAPASAPNIRLYANPSNFFQPAPTTYVGATITVIPAPSAAALVLLPAPTPRRRRGS